MSNKYMNRLKENSFYFMLLASIVVVTVLLVIISVTRQPEVAKENELDLNDQNTVVENSDPVPSLPTEDPILEQGADINSEEVTNVLGDSELGDNFIIMKEGQPEEGTTENKDEETKETFIPYNDSQDMLWPISGTILKDYAKDSLIYHPTLETFAVHPRISIKAAKNQEVLAAASGKVVAIRMNNFEGNEVVIDHGNGWVTTYGQLQDDLNIEADQIVKKGDLIGRIAEPTQKYTALGYHLEFGVEKDKTSQDPKKHLSN